MIIVNNLSKKFIVHQKKKTEMSFRELVMNLFKQNKEDKEEDFYALKNISFTINKGESISILGKNGSGKSTLLKVLSNILTPSDGEIVMEGRVASLLEVGTGFHGELTGRENIYLNGIILGMTPLEVRERFSKIVEFSEVEDFLEEPVKRYSSGMRLRLAFAVAIHINPDILIVDEVLAVGDASFQSKCIEKMKQLKQEGKILLFVSHDNSLVRELSEKSLLLKKGRVLFFGKTEEALFYYNSNYSAFNNNEIYKTYQK